MMGKGSRRAVMDVPGSDPETREGLAVDPDTTLCDGEADGSVPLEPPLRLGMADIKERLKTEYDNAMLTKCDKRERVIQTKHPLIVVQLMAQIVEGKRPSTVNIVNDADISEAVEKPG